jgi:rubrerythrin
VSRGYLAKCSNGIEPKKRFETREEAEKFRASMIGRGKWTARESAAYPCNQCGTFHAGHIRSGNRAKGPKGKNTPRHLDTQ